MEFAGEQFIFYGALLVLVSILAGLVSNRVGAPLLLVFLGLGMLVGEDGPGGVVFDNFRAAYVVGSLALAIILFDGGLRTSGASLRLAMWPALSLATVGVAITAALTGAVAAWLLGFGWIGGFLVGATVASTDAAAVFLLLHLKGTELKRRVSATLEVESGINDPMAVFLTIACIEVLLTGGPLWSLETFLRLLLQLMGGAAIGLLGGVFLAWLLNRLEIAAGLYPIVAVSVTVALFGGAQLVGASGFLAVYLAGLTLGNRRHRAAQVISRFHDGLAWLSQIGMFLMLGLLVTPHGLLPDLWRALAIAAVLIVIARPLAVWLCLLPFRFTWQEITFISWVGLRGAVPIFLATLPVLAGLPGGMTYFNVAFVVVLTSLVVQGWTVAAVAKWLGLELPPEPGEAERLDLDALTGFDRDVAGYRVGSNSPSLSYPFHALPVPKRTRIIAVIREGVVMNRDALVRLEPEDYVLLVAPPQHLHTLGVLFASRSAEQRSVDTGVFGEFVLDGDVMVGAVAGFYSFEVADGERNLSLSEFLVNRLPRRPVVGDRLRLAPIELVVREMVADTITRVGIELEPGEKKLPLQRVGSAVRRWFGAVFRRVAAACRRFGVGVRGIGKKLRRR